jgi:hypothetical protein
VEKLKEDKEQQRINFEEQLRHVNAPYCSEHTHIIFKLHRDVANYQEIEKQLKRQIENLKKQLKEVTHKHICRPCCFICYVTGRRCTFQYIKTIRRRKNEKATETKP